jgi:hypothetical protein
MIWFDPTASHVGQSSLRDSLITALVSGFWVFVGTVATLVFSWLKDRDDFAKRTREIDEATKRVAFWNSWLKTLSLTKVDNNNASLKEHARQQIIAVADDLDLFLKEDEKPKIDENYRGYVQCWLR